MRMGNRITAIVLLAVYLSMLFISSFHVHTTEFSAKDECEQCVNHVPHAGHLVAGIGSSHVCLLCQLQSLTYLVPVVAVAVVIVKESRLQRDTYEVQVARVACGIVGLRAPPVVPFFLAFKE